jgi:hypothetical protein
MAASCMDDVPGHNKLPIRGAVDGGAFPQGSTIMLKYIPCRKNPKDFQNAHYLFEQPR